MIELFQLEQLAAFGKYGTLSKAAEALHLSQPTLTRSMQKLEAEFGVSLFRHAKNKLEFNENGELAAEYAVRILNQTRDMLELVRAKDRASHTLSFGTCAPVPALILLQNAAQAYPNMAVSTESKDNETLLAGLRNGEYQAIILPYQPEGQDLCWKEYGTETLAFALPPGHPLANRDGLYMRELDGENMLLYADIGFWHGLPAQKMPHSRFLVQSDRFAFTELVQSSVLPSFVTDAAMRLYGPPENRKVVPILDPEATVAYYAVCLKQGLHRVKRLF